jgi:chromosome segregation ATPase
MFAWPAIGWVTALVPLFFATAYLGWSLWPRLARVSSAKAATDASDVSKCSALVALSKLDRTVTSHAPEKTTSEASYSLEFLKDELERVSTSHEQEKKVLLARHAAAAEDMAQKLATLEGRVEALIIQHLQERNDILAEAIKERNALEAENTELKTLLQGQQGTSGASGNGALEKLLQKHQELQQRVAELEASNRTLSQQLDTNDTAHREQLDRLVRLSLQEKAKRENEFRTLREREGAAHRAELERILVLAIEETNKVKRERDSLQLQLSVSLPKATAPLEPSSAP